MCKTNDTMTVDFEGDGVYMTMLKDGCYSNVRLELDCSDKLVAEALGLLRWGLHRELDHDPTLKPAGECLGCYMAEHQW